MNDYEKSLIEKDRNYMVVKANDLVLKSRYHYNVNQQKMIAYICSKIKPSNDKTKGQYQLEYEFEIADYIRLMGIQSTGSAYDEIKATLKSLRDKSYWLELDNGDETTVSWVDKATTNKRSGLAKYRIDPDFAPFLFDLRERYLSYGLINILNFNSKYSIRLYELLKAHYNLKRSQYGHKHYDTPTVEWIVDLDELRHLLMVDVEMEDKKGQIVSPKLTRFPDFRRYVLETAQEEINDLSDIKFFFEPITKGRKTVKIKFIIMQKDSIDRLVSQVKNRELLDGTEEKEN